MLRSLAALPLLFALSAPSFAEEVLHRPSESEPQSLDPQKMTSANDQAIARDLFVGLIALDPHGVPVPGDAEKWDIAPDGKTWTFHLRHDLKWSNGDPLNSADFLYSFRRLADPKTAADDPSDLKQVVGFEAINSGKEKDLTKLGVTAPDPYTLILTLAEPRLALKFLISDPQLFPLPKATIEKWGNSWTQPEHMVSNGPYVMKSWTPQSEIVLVKNPNFYDSGSVKIDEVHWLDVEDTDAAFRRYRGGELDWMFLSRNTIALARKDLADQLHTAPVNSLDFIFFNMAKGLLSQDIRIRQALSMATDRETIVTKVDPMGDVPAYSMTPPVITDYIAPKLPFADTPMPERIAEAQKLMQAAGYGPDKMLKLTMSYPTRESTRQILLAIRQMWQKIYVDLTLENSEWQAFQSAVNLRNYQLGIMAALGPYNDYENGLDNYRTDAGNFNWCGYSNPKFDDLFHRGGTATDINVRRDLMQQAEQVVEADYAIIPIDYRTRNNVVSPKLEGFVDDQVYPQTRYLALKP
jgi:oligopeptide transport system substrate-binding protein